jgi:hypothetical protein
MREGDRVMQLIDEDVAQGGRGFVQLEELIRFEKMKEHFTRAHVPADSDRRVQVAADALRESTQVELSPSERSVRRREPLPDRDEYQMAIRAVEENASLVEVSEPVLDLALQQLQERKPAVDLFHRARADLEDGIGLYRSGDYAEAEQLFTYARIKMVAKGEHDNDHDKRRPVGLGHSMFQSSGSCPLTSADRLKRFCYLDASQLNLAVCQLSIACATTDDGHLPLSTDDSAMTLNVALQTLKQIKPKRTRLLDVEPTPGEGNLGRDLLDDTVEMLVLKASALLIAAEVTLAQGQLDQARDYLRDCDRVCAKLGTSGGGGAGAAKRDDNGYVPATAEDDCAARVANGTSQAAATGRGDVGGGAAGGADGADVGGGGGVDGGAGDGDGDGGGEDGGDVGGGAGGSDGDGGERQTEVPGAMIEQAFGIWTAQAGSDPIADISANHGNAVGVAVRAACIEAIRFAAFDDLSDLKRFPPQLIAVDPAAAAVAAPDFLEGEARNFIRRFAEQVLRLNQKSVGEGEQRCLVLSKDLSSYHLPLDEDPNVRSCCDCNTLGELGVHFTQSQWNKPQARCKVCTQRQGLENKREDIRILRGKIAAEERQDVPASAVRYLLKTPTQAAIEDCRARLGSARREEDRRACGLQPGFLN